MALFRRHAKKLSLDATAQADNIEEGNPDLPSLSSRPVRVDESRPITLPALPELSDDLIKTAGEYERIHSELERTVQTELPTESATSAKIIFRGLGIEDPNTYDDAHDLFTPLISLSNIGPTDIRAWLVSLALNQTQAAALLVDIHQIVMPKVLLVFRDENSRYIGYYFDPSMVENLLPKVADSLSLQPPDSSHVRRLIEDLNQSGPTRLNALDELGHMGEAVADDLIRALRDDPDPNIRSNVSSAMENLPPERVVPALIEATSDSDPLVRQGAASALGKLGDVRAVPAIRDALARETDHNARDELQYNLGLLTNE